MYEVHHAQEAEGDCIDRDAITHDVIILELLYTRQIQRCPRAEPFRGDKNIFITFAKEKKIRWS